jgi:hypothetical protein
MTVTAEATSETLTLLAVERCDACGAQAVSVAKRDGLSDLLFCLHHVKQHFDALRESGWTITSDVEQINHLYNGNVPELEVV